MWSKADYYSAIARETLEGLTVSWQEWTKFLTTASRLYKYPFMDQVMIYAQRPDATACADYDLWNHKMNRYVRRGSKGIALLDENGDKPHLRYVFDVADTGARENSRTPWLWTMEDHHVIPIMAMLQRSYGVGGNDLGHQVAVAARTLADAYWADNQKDFCSIVDDSSLQEYDEYDIGIQFKATVATSITYTVLSRCGLEPEEYMGHEAFMPIVEFNTIPAVMALGSAVSQCSKQILMQIGETIRAVERETIEEWRKWDEEHLNLHAQRGLSDPEPETGRTAGEASGQVRADAPGVPEGEPSSDLQPPAAERDAVPAPAGDRGDGGTAHGIADAPAAGERPGPGQEAGRTGVGTAHERTEGPGRGSDPDGAYQQLSFTLPDAEPVSNPTIEGSSEPSPGPFSVPKSGDQASAQETAQEKSSPAEDHGTDYRLLGRLRADCDYFLGAGQKNEKHLWAGSVHAQIAKMRELYEALPEKPEWLTPEAIDSYAERMAPPYQVVVYHQLENGFDERQEYQTREEAEKAAQGYVNGTMEPDGFAYDGAAIYDLQQRTYLRIFGNYPYEAAQAQVAALDLSGQPITREGDTLTIGSGEPTHEMDITVSDEEYEAIRQAIPETETPTAYDFTTPPYHVGDTVYLENQEYQITELREDSVQLLPSGMAYPIYRAESRERFETLLRADVRNEAINEFLTVNPDTADQDLREVLAHGLIGAPDKAELAELLRTGKPNGEIAQWLGRAFPGIVETMELETGDTADYRTTAEGIELEVLDADEKRLAMLYFRWDEVAPLLRGLYVRQLDGFGQEQAEPAITADTTVEEPIEPARPIE